MYAFLTGSRAYGVPKMSSDTDIVVLLRPQDRRTLAKEFLSPEKYANYQDGSLGLKIGKLNLICPADEADFARWKVGTEVLINRRLTDGPVTREEAIETFTALRVGNRFKSDESCS